MKTCILSICLSAIFLIIPTRALSQREGFGAGIIIGEPTGISLKGWTSADNAIDAGLAWSFERQGSVHIHADYLWHSFHVFQTRELIPLYYGIGGRIETGRREDARVGVRMVIGVAYLSRTAPFDVFLEVAPILDLAPATDLDVNAGLGARFWFR